MTREEWYAAWAPEDSLWAPWVRPVLFAQLDPAALAAEPGGPAFQGDVFPSGDGRTAIVLDIAGPEAVRMGLRLARAGYRPVPLFNGSDGPSPLIDVRAIGRELLLGAPALPALPLRPDAPPAFLLDADRMKPTPGVGVFDNRWVVLPQDFPSGTMLRAHGIERVVLVQQGRDTPARDLEHVLLRWQDAGVLIRSLDLARGGEPTDLDVKKPAWFHSLWWGIVALSGLRRSNVGGFGGVVPQQTSGGGFA